MVTLLSDAGVRQSVQHAAQEDGGVTEGAPRRAIVGIILMCVITVSAVAYSVATSNDDKPCDAGPVTVNDDVAPGDAPPEGPEAALAAFIASLEGSGLSERNPDAYKRSGPDGAAHFTAGGVTVTAFRQTNCDGCWLVREVRTCS
jgi:hypothetical protein